MLTKIPDEEAKKINGGKLVFNRTIRDDITSTQLSRENNLS